ncbi:hypothetical protein [Arthrobacter sp. efr-133-R2A-120]|uniref:hypothetical protein n=1 Tax=Arthrobacter sp. efr-133-R2A-120 TaxID=3040277 RepID=UPI00254E80FB|nr:hypothetical protein [Arthrobacter sp. efr-133-R2A-120]
MTEPINVRNMKNPPPVTQKQALRAAREWGARIELPEQVIDYEASRTGPKRKIPFQALIVGGLYHHMLRQPQCLHWTAIAQDLELLDIEQKKELGIIGGEVSNKNLWQTHDSLEKLLARFTVDGEPWVDPATGEILSEKATRGNVSRFDVLLNSMIAEAIHDSVPSPIGIAIDGTGVEAYAVRHWKIRGQPEQERMKPEKKPATKAGKEESQEWSSVDPDAHLGKKTATENHPKEMFFGYEAHFGVDANPKGTLDAPRVIRSFVLVPASSSRAEAGLTSLDIVKKIAGAAYRLTTVYADRGYSILKATNWQLPLWSRNLRQVCDLTINQRTTMSSTRPGTIYIDGGLFTMAIPKRLYELDSSAAPNINAAEKERRAKLYDERSHYAYHPHGARNPENGHQRYKGPATAGKLRCPNNAQSMRLGYENPETDCTPGEPCGCSGTFTLVPDDHARESQWPLYGTTSWVKQYAARNAVESFNADVRTNKLSWRRGYVKTFTRPRTAFLLALSLASLNFRIVRDWSFKRRKQNPWGGEAWDFGPEPKKNRERRTKTLDERMND